MSFALDVFVLIIYGDTMRTVISIGRGLWTFSAAVLVLSSINSYGTEQVSSHISPCGSYASQGNLSAVFAVVPFGGVSASETLAEFSGLSAVNPLHPEQLSASGLAREWDLDNDDDGLADALEVSGTAFDGYAVSDPNNPDSDGDGMPDGAEAEAGFDPLDAGHRPWIESVEQLPNGSYRFVWNGKGGGAVTRLAYSDHLEAGSFTNVILSTNIMAGTAPWYKITNSCTWAGSFDQARYIRIQIIEE
jgi:hypothetical protein